MKKILSMSKIISIVGARPQFVKAVSVSGAIREFNKNKSVPRIEEMIIHTGQHYDYGMNGVFFKEFRLKRPDHNLGVGSQSHGRQTAMMLERIEPVLVKERPDMVLVYGDTNSTLAGALAAKKLDILLAHVEAGLRSYNMGMPEEVNRVIADRISDILFCPSENAVKNLHLEGIMDSRPPKFPRVFNVGDVMYDTALSFLAIAKKRSAVLDKLSLKPKSYYLATVHRAENTDNKARLRSILNILDRIADKKSPVIFPAHPRTEKIMKALKYKPCSRSFRIIEPVSYLDMLMLEKNSKAVLTDSGGVQKEAYFLKVPCLTLRGETEWVETVKAGFNVVTGINEKRIEKALNIPIKLKIKQPEAYGNGNASRKIVRIISRILCDIA